MKKTFILIHGSWHGGWCWQEVEKRLVLEGHTVFSPTLSGMSKNKNNIKIGLNQHIADIQEIIVQNDLNEVILVGHSYSGMILRGIEDKIHTRIKKIIYLDAFIPENNQSLFDLLGKEREIEIMRDLVDSKGLTKLQGAKDTWLIPPLDAFKFGVKGDQAIWLKNKLVHIPVLSFQEKIKLTSSVTKESHYILCNNPPIMKRFKDKAESKGWKTYELDSGHDVMITNPRELVNLILQII